MKKKKKELKEDKKDLNKIIGILTTQSEFGKDKKEQKKAELDALFFD